MQAELTHVRLLVEDYRDCFLFYKDVLGLTPAWGDEETGYAEFQAGSTRLAVFGRSEMSQVVGTAELPAGAQCQDRIAVVLRVDDVQRAYESLCSAGVQFLTEPEDRADWGIRTAHFRDPAGNLLEINQRI